VHLPTHCSQQSTVARFTRRAKLIAAAQS
jgi:hypothetical protein